jgi:hypothetical protein
MVFEDGVPLYGLISTDSPPRTASLALASLDHHWGRRCLERVGLALAERGSLRPSAWFVGCGSGASLPLRRDALAPVLSNRPLWWQLIQECLHSVARPERFRDPPHRETWSRLVAICDTSHTELRKVSCPAPAPPQSLRNTAPMNKPLVGCSDLPSPIFFYEAAQALNYTFCAPASRRGFSFYPPIGRIQLL